MKRQNLHRAKRILCGALGLVISISFILSVPSSLRNVSAAGYTDAKVQSFESDIANLEKKIKAKKAELANLSNSLEDLEKKAAGFSENIELVNQKITKTEELLTELNNQIIDKEAEITEKEADIDMQRERFKARVRAAYMEGNVSYLEILLGSENLNDLLSRSEYINSLIEFDNKLLEKYQVEKEKLDVQKQNLNDAKALQDDVMLALEEEKADLKKQKDEVEKINATLRTEYASLYAEYKKMQAEEDKLNKELEAYIVEQQRKNQRQYVGGEFIWPVDIQFNRVTSEFGWRILWGYKDNHYGIDIPCTLGSNVYASNGGVVLKAEFHYSYGWYVLIDHGGGKSTLYAHNSSLCVKQGDTVTQGQVIAKAGTTGNSYGVHCHFEYRLNGVRQNPRNIVSQP